jgi:hypothetical protein
MELSGSCSGSFDFTPPPYPMAGTYTVPPSQSASFFRNSSRTAHPRSLATASRGTAHSPKNEFPSTVLPSCRYLLGRHAWNVTASGLDPNRDVPLCPAHLHANGIRRIARIGRSKPTSREWRLRKARQNTRSPRSRSRHRKSSLGAGRPVVRREFCFRPRPPQNTAPSSLKPARLIPSSAFQFSA